MADLISSSLMLDLIDLNESAMPGTCTFYRRAAAVQNERGETVYGDWAAVGPAVRCRLVWEGTQRTDVSIGDRLTGEAAATLSVPLGTDVQDDDQVEVSSPDFQPGVILRFNVVGPTPKPDSYATALDVPVNWLKEA